MRLVCPNCDARYEVGSDAVPQSGRDVQCSNCGQTWFQPHPEPAPPAPEIAPRAPDPEPEPEGTAQGQRRRPLAKGVEEVLREEGERERRARSQEASGNLESQPDLGLDDGNAVVSTVAVNAVRERVAQTRGPGQGAKPKPKPEPTARRDLLPDIDQINSSLRSNEERKGADAAPPPGAEKRIRNRKRGFRLGFGLALFAITGAILLYRFAPEISRRVPDSLPFLTAYVDWVNEARITLDQAARDGGTWIRNLVDQATADSG